MAGYGRERFRWAGSQRKQAAGGVACPSRSRGLESPAWRVVRGRRGDKGRVQGHTSKAQKACSLSSCTYWLDEVGILKALMWFLVQKCLRCVVELVIF